MGKYRPPQWLIGAIPYLRGKNFESFKNAILLGNMVYSCCAYGCTNRYGRVGKRFFSFPKDKKQRDKWIAAIKRENWTPTPHSKVCSDHFVSGNYACYYYNYIIPFNFLFCVR